MKITETEDAYWVDYEDGRAHIQRKYPRTSAEMPLLPAEACICAICRAWIDSHYNATEGNGR